MRLIDRLRAAFRRSAPRRVGAAQALRRFDAARIDRLTAQWLATNESINEELRSDLDRLRHRGRQLAGNNDYARKFVGMCQDNIIGANGIKLQVRIEDAPGAPDRLANAAIEQAWAEWSGACDVTGRQSLREMCRTIVGGLPTDGEFLVRLVRGSPAGNRFGLALQVIDVDRVDTGMTGVARNGGAVKAGVEVDVYGRPVALHIFAGHPNDGASSRRERERVPMSDLLHGFRVERAGQLRGIPWMAPGMLSLHHLGSFMTAALVAAEHGANHFGFFVSPDGSPPPGVGQDDGAGQTVLTSQPGTYDTLPTGYDFRPQQSQYPNDVFGPFVKTCLQRIASGWRVAYHSLANDLEGVSFSSIRSGTLEERDRWAADQEWFIGAFLEPVFGEWLRLALLAGAIVGPTGRPLPAAKLQKFARHEWQARRWDWVDPQKDMQAKVLAVQAGLISPQDVAASLGYDFEDNLKAIRDANLMAASLGVDLVAYAGTARAAGAQLHDGPELETP